ncbi:MAG: hypothetical protein II662_06030, partial [Bacteroidales bacterium]|nr:hypothetical protein [Bacteroidales bacterium]
TDQMGEIVLTDLEPGVYLVQEVSADPSHIVNSTPQEVKLEAGYGIVEPVEVMTPLVTKICERTASPPMPQNNPATSALVVILRWSMVWYQPLKTPAK